MCALSTSQELVHALNIFRQVLMRAQSTAPSKHAEHTLHELMRTLSIHRKKKVCEFPVPSRDVTTKLFLGGNNDAITELFLPRGSLVSDIPAGDGKLVNLFLRCTGQKLMRALRVRHQELMRTLSVACASEIK
jgi:hypothetical protein